MTQIKPPSTAPPRQTGEMKDDLIVVCRSDGAIIAGNAGSSGTVAELAEQMACEDLLKRFEEFVGAGEVTKSFLLKNQAAAYRARVRKLDAAQGEALIALDLSREDADLDESALLEAGKLTSRLIHDFKNQMGGLKLYAAYLKKRFADNTEGIEISEKIIQGLNSMADNAVMVAKLTRPREMHRQSGDLGSVLAQAVGDCEAQAGARRINIVYHGKDGIILKVDAQLLRLAFGTIIARAVEMSPEGGEATVRLDSKDGEAVMEIADSGESLSEYQLNSLFDFVTNERLSKASLDLAFARRIIEKHDGEVAARNGANGGVTVNIKLPIQ